jgi:hypothetical protein
LSLKKSAQALPPEIYLLITYHGHHKRQKKSILAIFLPVWTGALKCSK